MLASTSLHAALACLVAVHATTARASQEAAKQTVASDVAEQAPVLRVLAEGIDRESLRAALALRLPNCEVVLSREASQRPVSADLRVFRDLNQADGWILQIEQDKTVYQLRLQLGSVDDSRTRELASVAANLYAGWIDGQLEPAAQEEVVAPPSEIVAQQELAQEDPPQVAKEELVVETTSAAEPVETDAVAAPKIASHHEFGFSVDSRIAIDGRAPAWRGVGLSASYLYVRPRALSLGVEASYLSHPLSRYLIHRVRAVALVGYQQRRARGQLWLAAALGAESWFLSDIAVQNDSGEAHVMGVAGAQAGYQFLVSSDKNGKRRIYLGPQLFAAWTGAMAKNFGRVILASQALPDERTTIGGAELSASLKLSF